MPIIYRDDGDWGTGKGANLTPVEVDGNFWSIHERVTELETNPPAAISIAGFEVADNMLTIQMSDSSTFGPFPMPLVPLRWVGEWQASTTYFKNDFFSTGWRALSGPGGACQRDHLRQ